MRFYGLKKQWLLLIALLLGVMLIAKGENKNNLPDWKQSQSGEESTASAPTVVENDFWTVHKCDFWTKF